MKWFGNILPYLLATAAVIFLSYKSSVSSEQSKQTTGSSQQSSVTENKGIVTDELPLGASRSDSRGLTTNPKRLTVNVKVAEPNDLKIKEGQEIKEGDTIADRTRERLRLNSQKASLNLSLQRLRTMTINAPTPPMSVPTVKTLPPVNYLEQEAAVEQSKQLVVSVESEIETKKQSLDYLKQLPNLDPIVLEHEEANLKKLSGKHTSAIRDYQLAVGKLQTAKNAREYQEYTASIETAQRVESINQSRSNYEAQLATYQQRLADREFQLTQLKTKLNEVDNEIASLSQVKAPYGGTVRRIKWLGQDADGSLNVEITLMVSDSEG
jgi:hypothetical protein